MGACLYGASTRPEFVGIRRWLNADTLELAVQAFLSVVFPSWRVALASSLVNFVDLCELNPDPPEPFDVRLLYEQTQPFVFGPAVPLPAVVDWVYRYVQYQAFLEGCVCNAAPVPPAGNCWALASGASTNVNNSIVAQTVMTGLQPIIDTWSVSGNGSLIGQGDVHLATVSSGWNSADQFLEFQRPNGTWVSIVSLDIAIPGEIFITNAEWPAGQHPVAGQIPMRIRHAAGPAGTFTDFAVCWNPAPAAPPPPLPIFVEPPGVPAPPASICTIDQVCQLVNEINRRLTLIAGQVSDIQAELSGRDVWTELERQNISGEGETTLVLGTRAVSVELTALGEEAFTSALGRPRGLMRVGSIRYGDGIGYSPRRFIDADRFDDVLPPGALSVSWQLLPGTLGVLKFLG